MLDILFHALHLFVIGFNVFGWVHKSARVAHRYFVIFTAFFWLVIGSMVDTLGYCPLTDGHWRVKIARGENNLPASYIDYLLREFGVVVSSQTIDMCTGIVFVLVVIITLVLWRREKVQSHHPE